MSGAGKVVCVTGASGYVASWVVKDLLERGYTVRATVRSLNDPSKIVHLKALEGADERLHFFEADLMKDGSFDPVVDGCEAVFHTASPVFHKPTDPQAELIEPAVKGTINVLKSCSKVPSIRRVVLTSSIASVTENQNPKGPDVLIDETWFSDPAYCEEAKMWYHLSKTLAEEAAWKYAEERGINLVVLNPTLVIGPLLQPTFNFTYEFFLNVITGKEIWPYCWLVDVRDVAHAHILAFENPSASGRYCLVGASISQSELQQILNKLYPSLNLPVISSNKDSTCHVSKKKAEDLGISFTPLEVSLKDTVESLKEKNFLNL